jgi:hypothetical protein
VTIYTSSMIANQIYTANASMVGPGGGGMGGMPPSPGMIAGLNRGGAGMYGERMAAMMGSAGQFGLGAGRLGLELGMGAMGTSAGMAAGGMMGMGALGVGAMGLAGSAAFTVPAIALGSVFRAYGGAFSGGMQEQASLNSTLRNNVNFLGGSGPMGRGFDQGQMGQIGSALGGMARSNPMTSMNELTGLVAGGAEAGMLNGPGGIPREVQQFTTNFRRMVDTLKSVQRELGGTLTDALSFVRSSQQAGIFQNADRVNFAAEVRTAEAVTGMSRTQLTALAATGANISRSFGGLGRQGAVGALRGAETLGAALSSGGITAEQLSEATGGLTGDDAMMAMTNNMMARAGRFSRTGMGRFSLFAMANREGNGLDSDMLRRFRTGDISVGDVSRRAHENVGRMGRAAAINNEGHLRGEMMEEGGLSAQIGMMRLMVGDRALDRGDNFAQLVMQRRFHMSRPESELMTSLMRNQGSIAERESLDRVSSRREADRNTDFRENRGLDAFMTRLEHGVEEATGLTQAREVGRSLVSRVSRMIERATDNILGTGGDGLTTGDRGALSRMSIGRASAADVELIRGGMSGRGGVSSGGLFDRGLGGETLHAMGLHSSDSLGETLERRGVTGLRGKNGALVAERAVADARRAGRGIVSGASADALSELEGGGDATIRRLGAARSVAAALHDSSALYDVMGDANATDAYLSRGGFGAGTAPSRGALANMGRGMTWGEMGRHFSRTARGDFADPMRAVRRMVGYDDNDTSGNAVSFLASGGHLGASLSHLSAEGIERGLSEVEEAAGPNPEARRRARESLLSRSDITSWAETAGAGVTEDAMRAVTSTDSFRSRIGRLTSMEGNSEAMMREIASMRREAEAGDVDPGHAAAMRSLAAQMEDSIRSNSGHLGREFSNAGRDPRRDAAMMREMNTASMNASSMADALEGVSGAGGVRSALSRAAGAFGEFDAGGGNNAMSGAREALIGLDPDSDEYREIANAIGSADNGDALLTSVSESRRRRRDLSGRGRTGARGAGEAAFNMVSGNRSSELDLRSGGRRVRSMSAAFGLLRRGGSGANDILESLTASMNEMGVTNASSLTRELGRLAEGGFTESEATKFERRMSGEMASGSLGEASRRANEEALRRANPLDAQRNDLLTQIRDGVRSMNGGSTQAVTAGEAE